MKHCITFLCCLIISTALLAKFELPAIHSTIMLDAKFYGEGDSNTGLYDTSNRYQVRKAALEFEGQLNDFDYSIEFGVSTCSGNGNNLKLMDASLMYQWSDNLQFGVKQGHVLRGFAGSTECRDRLTMEKPIFMKTFATCHPTGFVAKYYHEFGEITSLETEIALMNGTNNTLDGEHDYNLGVIFQTPIDGLGISATYNLTAANYYDPQTYEPYSEDGYRSIVGINYENYNITATAEYITGEGFDVDDREMIAYYAQGAYAFRLNLGKVQYIQPVVLYEYWDKDSGTDSESEYTYLNAGLNIGLSDRTKLKFNYKIPQDEPDNYPEQETSFVARLQMGF